MDEEPVIINNSYTVDESNADLRLDVFLAECSSLSRSRIKSHIKNQSVTVNGVVVIKPSHPIAAGDIISITEQPPAEPDFLPENIPLDILYEDDTFVVVNKPPGMVVHPGRGNVTGTLASGLLYRYKNIEKVGAPRRPGIVHRLDKDTSGVMACALTPNAHTKLSDMIRTREANRIYTAFVWGEPNEDTGIIDAPIGRHSKDRTKKAVHEGGRNAVTHFTVLERYDFLTKLEVRLHTGRTHQIRVHLAHIGRHVFGDPDYGGREKRLKGYTPHVRDTARFLLKRVHRQALHASSLQFTHPFTGEDMRFEAPLPNDLAWLQAQLRREAGYDS